MGKFDQYGFSFADVKPGEGREPIASGRYHVKVERWEESLTKGGKFPGSLMYTLGVSVASGEQKGHWVFQRYILAGDAARNAIGDMKSLWVACGVPLEEINADGFDPTDEWGEENLIGREFDAQVGFEAGKDDYRDSNKITDYFEHVITSADLLV